MPPYFAGRESEKQEFTKLLEQTTILRNMALSGLRGVGKTVLLDVFKPIAQKNGWLWVGNDLSESVSLSEANISTRFLTDLSMLTSSIVINEEKKTDIGFNSMSRSENTYLNFQTLWQVYENTPGLAGDKLKHVFELVWSIVKNSDRFKKGIVFAYDEAQNLADHSEKDQFPLSLLLDTFQSIQKKNIPFMLALTGLPTLFPKLVESRTFAERMFMQIMLDKLDKDSVKQAIKKPLENYEINLTDESIEKIVQISGGYPYFVQFICREVYDLFIQQVWHGSPPSVPVDEILHKLDSDFFSGRWARATDRQRELLAVIAELKNCDEEFSVQEVVAQSKTSLEKPFSSSHANQMLSTLLDSGLVFKNRHGVYSFAIPLLGGFIKRQKIKGTSINSG